MPVSSLHLKTWKMSLEFDITVFQIVPWPDQENRESLCSRRQLSAMTLQRPLDFWDFIIHRLLIQIPMIKAWHPDLHKLTYKNITRKNWRLFFFFFNAAWAFCWHCQFIPLEQSITANQYNVILTHRPHNMMKHFYPDGRAGFQDDSAPTHRAQGHGMV